MSGYKHATVTISQDEYRRLHEAHMKKKFREYANIKAQNSEPAVDVRNMILQMENRQRQFEKALTSLDKNFNQIDEGIVQDILMQNALCYGSLAAALNESSSNAHESLVHLSERFGEEIQRERENFNENLHALVLQLDTESYKEYTKEETARQWLNRSELLADFIQEQFDHERFVPGRLSRILRSLSYAQSNLSEGFYESSLHASQQTYLELSDLHFELEQRVLQWQAEFERTYSSVREMVGELASNAKINALGLQGEELPDLVDLNFWTDGKYLQLMGHSQQLLDNLVQDQQSITEQDLTRIYSHIRPAIRESFESLIYEARIKALNSQLRMNIAERALQALENHGFALGNAGYNNGDMRAPFTAQLDSADGSQVVIQVLPTESTVRELSNELVVITNHPTLKTEHEARLQWDELSQALTQYNLNVSRPDVHPIPTPSEQEQTGISHLLKQNFTRSKG